MTARYIVGDVFDVLDTLEPDSVDLIFSSPPFLALRSYLPADHPDKAKEIGSEPTPADFLDTLLDVVEACDRVLAPHGSLCFELGDTYSGSGGAGGDYNEGGLREDAPAFSGSAAAARGPRGVRQGHERRDGGHHFGGNGWPLAKSLCLIPSLFAASLAYGHNMLRPERTTPRWRVRNQIVWARSNPPVGALGDKYRPATSYVTVATKSAARYFDLDAVREPAKHQEHNDRYAKPGGAYHAKNDGERTALTGDRGGGLFPNHPAGAPPLDYWVIPTKPYSGVWQGDTFYRASPDCPEHSLRAIHQRWRTAPGDELREALLRNSRRTDLDRALTQLCEQTANTDLDSRDCSATPDWLNQSIQSERTTGSTASSRTPTPPTGDSPSADARTAVRTSRSQAQPTSTGQTSATLGLEYAPTATPRNTASSRTGPAPATTTPGTPSAQTPDDTEHTSASPASSAPDGCTSESRSEATLPAELDPETDSHTVHTFRTRCPCTQYTESGSHYATFPPDLVVKPVKSMCPQRVCRVCGEPSRRIVESTRGDLTDDGGKSRLGSRPDGGPWSNRVETSYETLGWTDCGHDEESDGMGRVRRLTDAERWRPGCVLDPFAGSGTTLAVATGHGRDAIGIDLDERNADLALDRVGPMLLTVERLSDEGAA